MVEIQLANGLKEMNVKYWFFFFYRFPEKQDSLELTVGATLHTLTAIVYRSYWHDLGEQSMLNTCDISKDISVNHVISNEVQ